MNDKLSRREFVKLSMASGLAASHAIVETDVQVKTADGTCDAVFGAHAEWFGYEQKRERAKREGVQAWVNPEEYHQFVARVKRAFEDQVDLELGVKK